MLKEYITTNRELSWLDFNFRVLEEANDKLNPLIERLKFLSITASNLDEFFMVRVASLHAQISSGIEVKDAAGLTPKLQLEEVIRVSHAFSLSQDKTYKKLISKLENEGVQLLGWISLSKGQKKFCSKYFNKIIEPVLTPLAVDSSRPFPKVLGRSINIAVKLKGKDKKILYALVQLPSLLPRFVELEEQNQYILIEDIILMHISFLFKGYKLLGTKLFRVTRDSDFEIDDDVLDIMDEIQKSLQKRRRGQPVRLEIMKDASNSEDDGLIDFLVSKLDLSTRDIFYTKAPLDLTFLFSFLKKNQFNNLRFQPAPPLVPIMLADSWDIYRTMTKKDILVQHPYESFDCVVDFIKKAAEDPNVLAIKQTLYRISGNSPIIDALIGAVESGKQVTVLVELKARFDEENNIAWAKKLEKAGCHVIYGLVGLKVHCKVLLVVRREKKNIKKYLHMSTGNYNDSTAKLYTDTGFFTTNEDFCADASMLFNMLTGYSDTPEFKKFIVAPSNLKKYIIDSIINEIKYAKQGKNAALTIKVNSLIDYDIIVKLYEASCAGVKINLIIRGINGLRSGIKNLSENIKVISIVGRYLEHDRIYHFHANGKDNVYLSSADLMPRNLVRRVEVMFPIEDESIKMRILNSLHIMLSDNVKARRQQKDGKYVHAKKKARQINSQNEIYYQLKQQLQKDFDDKSLQIIPIMSDSKNDN